MDEKREVKPGEAGIKSISQPLFRSGGSYKALLWVVQRFWVIAACC